MNEANSKGGLSSMFLRGLVIAFAAAVAMTANAATPKVISVAGGALGDGKPATSASLGEVAAVVRDAKGNLYVSDIAGCRIRKINLRGIISTYAGTGICGYGGDGGPAKSAMLMFPYGLAFDSHGNLFVADEGNSVIREINSSGTITTIAGNGVGGYSGDGGPAAEAEFWFPQAVAIDPSGAIYIADSSNFVIRKVDTSGIIRTVAGNHTYGHSGDGGPATSAQLSYVTGLWVDGSGSFFIADNSNARVRKVDTNGTITTIAGNGQWGNFGSGGPATSASIGAVQGLFVNGGTMYVSTWANIWTVNLASGVIDLVAGDASGDVGFNGDGLPALSTKFFSAFGVTLDSGGNLVIADQINSRVRRIGGNGLVSTIAGGYLGDGGPGHAAGLDFRAGGIVFDPKGDLYIADTYNNRVRKVTPAGVISTFAGTGFSGSSGDGGPATSATLVPLGIALDVNGDVFISDSTVIRRVDSNGTITTLAQVSANGLAVDGSGNVYAAGTWHGVVYRITPAGAVSIVAGVENMGGYNGDGIPATQATLSNPTGVAVDKGGNLYIAEWGGNRVRKVDTSGIISTVAGNGSCGYSGDGGPATTAMVCGPEGVALDGKGNFYIGDVFNHRVRSVDSAGTIHTLAGTGFNGYNGNRLPATSTNMFPTDIAVSPQGIVYLTDGASNRVRKIH